LPDEIRLLDEDPRFFAQCPKCCRKGKGVHFGQVYCAAFTKRKWERKPVCENCKTPLVLLFEVK
jgi:hypothetical protein